MVGMSTAVGMSTVDNRTSTRSVYTGRLENGTWGPWEALLDAQQRTEHDHLCECHWQKLKSKISLHSCEGVLTNSSAPIFGPRHGGHRPRLQKVLQAAGSRKKAAQPSGLKVADLLGGGGPSATKDRRPSPRFLRISRG